MRKHLVGKKEDKSCYPTYSNTILTELVQKQILERSHEVADLIEQIRNEKQQKNE